MAHLDTSSWIRCTLCRFVLGPLQEPSYPFEVFLTLMRDLHDGHAGASGMRMRVEVGLPMMGFAWWRCGFRLLRFCGLGWRGCVVDCLQGVLDLKPCGIEFLLNVLQFRVPFRLHNSDRNIAIPLGDGELVLCVFDLGLRVAKIPKKGFRVGFHVLRDLSERLLGAGVNDEWRVSKTTRSQSTLCR